MLTLYAHQHRGFTKEAARKVIQRFDADVRDADKDIIFGNLACDTDCRIVFTTGGLGMGTDLGDVARVVQFNPPRDVLARSKDASLRKKWLRYSLTKYLLWVVRLSLHSFQRENSAGGRRYW